MANWPSACGKASTGLLDVWVRRRGSWVRRRADGWWTFREARQEWASRERVAVLAWHPKAGSTAWIGLARYLEEVQAVAGDERAAMTGATPARGFTGGWGGEA